MYFFKIATNGSRLCEVADFQHKTSFEKLHLNQPQNCHTKHCTRHYAKPLLPVRCSFRSLVCRSFWSSAWTDTLFDKLWFELGLVRLGNVCGCEGLAFLSFYLINKLLTSPTRFLIIGSYVPLKYLSFIASPFLMNS